MRRGGPCCDHLPSRRCCPAAGCCMPLYQGLQRDAPLARSRLPLPPAAGRPAWQADLWHLEEVLCAQGHAQDRPDRSTVHPGDQQRWPRGRKRRQAARYAMARGRRRGLARTRKSLPKVGWVGCRRTGAARSTSSQGTKSWCTHVTAQATQWRRTFYVPMGDRG